MYFQTEIIPCIQTDKHKIMIFENEKYSSLSYCSRKYCLQYDFAALQIDHQFTVQSYNKLFSSVALK